MFLVLLEPYSSPTVLTPVEDWHHSTGGEVDACTAETPRSVNRPVSDLRLPPQPELQHQLLYVATEFVATVIRVVDMDDVSIAIPLPLQKEYLAREHARKRSLRHL